jgi:hypothetical protein
VVHTSQRLFFTQRQTSGFGACIDFMSESSDAFKVCKHRDESTDTIHWTIGTLFRDPIMVTSCPAWDCTRTKSQWCSICATCFFVEVAYHGNWCASRKPGSLGLDMPADGLELTLHTWMFLGGCELVFSPTWLNIAEQRGVGSHPIYPERTMLTIKNIALGTFSRVIKPAIQERYSQTCWSLAGIYHPSLLPAIDRAVALENDLYAAKYHEITKILRAAGHKVDKFDMYWLVQMALKRRLGWCDELVSSNRPEALRTALRILSQHKRSNATTRVKRLVSSVLAKLSCGWFKMSPSQPQ